jgi:cytochrome c peroxidase
MISRQLFAKTIVLAMTGSVGCFVLALFAWEPADPWRRTAIASNHTQVQGAFQTRLPWSQHGREVEGEGYPRAVLYRLLFSEANPTRQSDQSLPAHGEDLLPDASPPRGISPVPFPKDNPPTLERVNLGRLLFFDRRLSSDESLSCASCHKPEQAFADNETTSHGIGSQRGRRNTPTVINAGLQPYQFWDGRASSLEDQALLPFENPLEMGPSISRIVDRLNQIPQYRDAFRRVFGAPVTPKNLAQALASFERTVLAGDSAYDQYAAGNPTALSSKAAEGMKLFEGKANCRLCHQGDIFSDGLFHNLGVGWNGGGFADEGRKALTGIVKDRGAFKTPTLRQVAQTGPYMHDGSLASLEAVINFYDQGGKPNPHLDPLIQPLRLTLQEKEALVEFLRSLSGKVRF